MKDRVEVKGHLTIRVMENRDGVDRLLRTVSVKNLVVWTGRNALTRLVGGTTQSLYKVTALRVGEDVGGPHAPALTDVDLHDPIGNAYNPDATYPQYPTDGKILYQFTIPKLGSGIPDSTVLSEAGLFCDNAAAYDILFSRTTHPDATKTDAISLIYTWEIQF